MNAGTGITRFVRDVVPWADAHLPVLRTRSGRTLAGLSAMHGLVPPHPGPLIAVAALGANLGVTLAFGVLVAIPTIILAGPVLFALFRGGFVTRRQAVPYAPFLALGAVIMIFVRGAAFAPL